MYIIPVGLILRVTWALLPYLLFIAFSLFSGVFLVEFVKGRPEAAVEVAIADVEADAVDASWVFLKDGQLFLREGGDLITEKNKKRVKAETFVPYCSPERVRSWKREGGMSGALVLVQIDETTFEELAKKRQPAIPFELKGMMDDNRFEIPNELEDVYRKLGFTKLYLLTPGKEPRSTQEVVTALVFMAAIALGGLFWIRARRRARLSRGTYV